MVDFMLLLSSAPLHQPCPNIILIPFHCFMTTRNHLLLKRILVPREGLLLNPQLPRPSLCLSIWRGPIFITSNPKLAFLLKMSTDSGQGSQKTRGVVELYELLVMVQCSFCHSVYIGPYCWHSSTCHEDSCRTVRFTGNGCSSAEVLRDLLIGTYGSRTWRGILVSIILRNCWKHLSMLWNLEKRSIWKLYD